MCIHKTKGYDNPSGIICLPDAPERATPLCHLDSYGYRRMAKTQGVPTTLNQLPSWLPRLPAVGRRDNAKRPLFLHLRLIHIGWQDVETANFHGILLVAIYNKTKGCGKRFEIIFLPDGLIPRTTLCPLDSYACPKMAKTQGGTHHSQLPSWLPRLPAVGRRDNAKRPLFLHLRLIHIGWRMSKPLTSMESYW
jgi:hypothetical protein